MQADIHGHLHGGERREDGGTRLHHGSFHVPARRLELARLHRRNPRVIRLLFFAFKFSHLSISLCTRTCLVGHVYLFVSVFVIAAAYDYDDDASDDNDDI